MFHTKFYNKYFLFAHAMVAIFFFIFCFSFSLAVEFITGHNDTTTFIVSPLGSWSVSTWGTSYGTDKLFAVRGDGSKTVSWITKLAPGRYDVKAWVNPAPYAEDAHYMVVHSGITTSITRSQYLSAGDWSVDLGTYDFDSEGIVILTDYWTGLGNYVIADAVKYISTTSTGISWTTASLLDAVTLATTQDKPVLLYFASDKSADCQRLSKETFTDPTFIKWCNKFVTVQVQVESSPDYMREFKVYQVPTFIFLDLQGKERKRLIGFISAQQMIEEMNTQLGIMGQ
jgi:thioredoxin-related protein